MATLNDPAASRAERIKAAKALADSRDPQAIDTLVKQLAIMDEGIVAAVKSSLRALKAVPVLEQRAFLLEMVAGIAFLGLAVRSEPFLTSDETVTALAGRRGVVWVLWAQLLVFGVAVVAGTFGYMRLARLLGGEVLASSYIALVLYAGVPVGQGLLVYLLRAWPVRLAPRTPVLLRAPRVYLFSATVTTFTIESIRGWRRCSNKGLWKKSAR